METLVETESQIVKLHISNVVFNTRDQKLLSNLNYQISSQFFKKSFK